MHSYQLLNRFARYHGQGQNCALWDKRNSWWLILIQSHTQNSIGGSSSDLLKVNFWVPKGSFLGLLLFLQYINDLQSSIRISSPFHSTYYTGFLNIQDSICAINKTLNKYLRELIFWLNANKISLNVANIILFRRSNKKYDADLKIKLCRKRIHLSLYVKYLSVFIVENLSWKTHINQISTKLVKAKFQHFVNKDIRLSLYYAIFHSHLAYLCLVLGQAKFYLSRIFLLQKRAIKILRSAAYRDHTCPLFHSTKFKNFVDLVLLENCKYVNKCFNKDAFSLFPNHTKLTTSSHSYYTRSVSNGLIFVQQGAKPFQNCGPVNLTYYMSHTSCHTSHCVMCVIIFYLAFKQKKYCKCFPVESSWEKATLDLSLRHWNTGLVSSGASVISWGECVSLALVGHPSSDGFTLRMPYGVDFLHRPASQPIYSHWFG